MYWADVVARVIRRARLDGSEVTTIVSTGLETPGKFEHNCNVNSEFVGVKRLDQNASYTFTSLTQMG